MEIQVLIISDKSQQTNGIDVLGELEKLGVPPSWCNSGGRRQFRVMIGHLVAGLIPGRAYVKEIPSAEHKNNRVLWVIEFVS